MARESILGSSRNRAGYSFLTIAAQEPEGVQTGGKNASARQVKKRETGMGRFSAILKVYGKGIPPASGKAARKGDGGLGSAHRAGHGNRCYGKLMSTCTVKVFSPATFLLFQMS